MKCYGKLRPTTYSLLVSLPGEKRMRRKGGMTSWKTPEFCCPADFVFWLSNWFLQNHPENAAAWARRECAKRWRRLVVRHWGRTVSGFRTGWQARLDSSGWRKSRIRSTTSQIAKMANQSFTLTLQEVIWFSLPVHRRTGMSLEMRTKIRGNAPESEVRMENFIQTDLHESFDNRKWIDGRVDWRGHSIV